MIIANTYLALSIVPNTVLSTSHICSFNLLNNPMRQVLLTSILYRWRNLRGQIKLAQDHIASVSQDLSSRAYYLNYYDILNHLNIYQ